MKTTWKALILMAALVGGAAVAVVIMTNGDGFPKGTAAMTGKEREELFWLIPVGLAKLTP